MNRNELSLPGGWIGPVVGPKRRRRKARIVGQVRMFRVGVKCITDSFRRRNTCRRNLDFILTYYPSVRPVPFLVVAGDGKFIELVAVPDLKARSNMVKSKHYLRSLGR